MTKLVFTWKVNIPQSSIAVQSLIEASCGSLENSWEVGWSLASHSSGAQHLIDSSRAQVNQLFFISCLHFTARFLKILIYHIFFSRLINMCIYIIELNLNLTDIFVAYLKCSTLMLC